MSSARAKSGPRTRSKPPERVGSETRRERFETKETAIIDAAYEMFATDGFAKSTIADIAKEAGVAEGTVYLYFKNKEALAGGVIAKFYDQLTISAREGTDRFSTTAEKLRFLADHHLTNVTKELRILDLLTIVDRRLETKAAGVIYDMNKRYVSIFDGVIRDGIWRGEISEKYAPWMLRDIFYGGLDYAMKTILITDRGGEAKEFTDTLVRMIICDENQSNSEENKISEKKLSALAIRMEKSVELIEAALPKMTGKSVKKTI